MEIERGSSENTSEGRGSRRPFPHRRLRPAGLHRHPEPCAAAAGPQQLPDHRHRVERQLRERTPAPAGERLVEHKTRGDQGHQTRSAVYIIAADYATKHEVISGCSRRLLENLLRGLCCTHRRAAVRRRRLDQARQQPAADQPTLIEPATPR